MKTRLTPLSQLAAFLLLLALAACGQQGAPTATPPAVEMTVRAEPEPLAAGATTLIITLKDASGAAIDGAALQVHGDMDHEGMTPVDREASESAGGEYRVPFEWTMGGGWIVTVTAELPNNGGTVARDFNFFVEAVSSESVIKHPGGANAAATAESGAAAVDIAYQADSDPARTGDATVTITVTDSDHNPVTDASVSVTGDMAHEGMMPITGAGEHTTGGQYVVPLRWTMAGDWIVTVVVTRADGSQSEAVFNQTVVVP